MKNNNDAGMCTYEVYVCTHTFCVKRVRTCSAGPVLYNILPRKIAIVNERENFFLSIRLLIVVYTPPLLLSVPLYMYINVSVDKKNKKTRVGTNV